MANEIIKVTKEEIQSVFDLWRNDMKVNPGRFKQKKGANLMPDSDAFEMYLKQVRTK